MFTVWFFFLSAAVPLGFSRPVVFVDKTSLIPGERLTLKITLPKAESDSSPTLFDHYLENTRWRVLMKDKIETPSEIVWSFGMTTYLPGTAIIPALPISAGAKSFSTDRTPVTVYSTRKAHDEQMEQSFGKVPVPWDWRKVGRNLAIFSIVSFLIGWLVRAFFRRETRPAPVPLPPTPEEWLIVELTRLKTSSSDEPVREYLTLMHAFFERLETIPTLARTTSELEVQPRLKRFISCLRRCDRFKYQPVKEREETVFEHCTRETLRILQ